ncbi:MAG: flagellar export chaperone FlgN [Campylobacter sp.]
MLKEYLKEAIQILDELIILTDSDIKNIKEAKHSVVDESVKKKNELVKNFESAKSKLDKELVRVSKENNSTNLASILDDEVKSNLVLMRSKLEDLYSKNKEYARYVVMIKDFFDSLVASMFKDQNSGDGGYTKSKPTPESLLKARV